MTTERRFIHVYTGHSKGKTTAATGLAVRAKGAGWRVLFCSFFKPDGSSEHHELERLGITFRRFNWRGTFFKKYTPEEMREQREDLQRFLAQIAEAWQRYDLVVLDEIVYAITSNLISEKDFLAFLATKPDLVELVMTGRDFPQTILAKADYITDMQPVKHPYDAGFLPRKGVEF